MIDPDHLLSYDIPEVRQAYGPRDTAFYALSIGIGHDPMDADDLRFVGSGAPRPFPTLPLVLGHPGFWLGNSDTGVDAVRLVHGEQGITIHAPLPPEGQVIGKTRVTGLIDKGAGRGALLYSEKELRDAATGALYATTTATIFLRGDGGFSGTPGSRFGPGAEGGGAHTPPASPPDARFETRTRPEQALWYRWNGDHNPLHLSPEVAAKAGFARPILHGLCTLGIAAYGLVRTLCDRDPARLRGLRGRFTAAVTPGETLRTEVWRDGSFRTVEAESGRVVVGDGLAVID
ncbi:3-alpha,7-alpha,12-alpha-trihydroxy-5-beta-cholest-24-enoyl-CoA hydratase [Defluviimonas sp. 20V17]|uniref:Acyl dehydratase n=1 Tax=Allgaiera indica TaxID=765699 RepID=A0AAN4UTJ2_9RHOB|nr:MaoC/PaaZ C-terminal domain-containing protein [Allgaiera indica]KDB01684.1 3-alpha,7-alpha,12-alpha-trihydroxy-5-beta-cholest-24-enoyl-CoA hydratase [Defluviimonas sp. 20V17]GHE04027.1 MaoC family protein [Allgaiera indica]SDX33974.1 Acyl dehydratase [Allgaiera indica]